MEAQALEKQLELEQHLNKQLTAAATTNKKHLLSIITQVWIFYFDLFRYLGVVITLAIRQIHITRCLPLHF